MALRGEPKPWTHIWSPKRLRSQVFRAAVKSSNSGTSNFRDLHREERLTLVVDVTALLPKFR
jgi:hypothetical protein